MKNQRVVVTGLSAITPLGKNIQETWANIMANKCGVRNIGGDSPVLGSLKCQLGATLPKDFKEKDYKVRLADGRLFGLTNALA